MGKLTAGCHRNPQHPNSTQSSGYLRCWVHQETPPSMDWFKGKSTGKTWLFLPWKNEAILWILSSCINHYKSIQSHHACRSLPMKPWISDEFHQANLVNGRQHKPAEVVHVVSGLPVQITCWVGCNTQQKWTTFFDWRIWYTMGTLSQENQEMVRKSQYSLVFFCSSAGNTKMFAPIIFQDFLSAAHSWAMFQVMRDFVDDVSVWYSSRIPIGSYRNLHGWCQPWHHRHHLELT